MEQTELLKERECFGFMRSWWNALKHLPANNKVELFDAILDYSFTGEEPELTNEFSQALWVSWFPTLKRNMAQYLKSKKGGAPKGNQNARKQPKNNLNSTQNQPENKQIEIEVKNKSKKESNRVKSATHFSAPTLDDVKTYCTENNLEINVEQFFYYYDAVGWKTNRGAALKSWQSALRGWIARERDFPHAVQSSSQNYIQAARRGTEVSVESVKDYGGDF